MDAWGSPCFYSYVSILISSESDLGLARPLLHMILVLSLIYVAHPLGFCGTSGYSCNQDILFVISRRRFLDPIIFLSLRY